VQHTYSGPHTPRVRDRWGGRDFLWHQLLAQRGYVVFICDNRSASGKGRKYAKACWRNLGQSELHDLEDAVDWLAKKPYIDGERIAIWGWSYGGYQTLYNLTHSKKWAVGVAVNPVTDWRLYDTIYTERYGGLPSNNAEGYEKGSVNNAAKNLHGKLMLIAGAMDDNVHMQNSFQFLHALQQAQKDCDFMVYPRVRHGIGDLQQQVHLFTRFAKFLKENL
jgi:dipeptidyl-peptidase-4